ncbi:hypothetical protein C8Q77DRAFT_1051897 [Trametes polyzona]|nr:hypothetical protein C8Q77DRAFT_1051897 [Trametes polyzona]
MLQRRLRSVLQREAPGGLNRTNVHQYEPSITAALKRAVEDFDKSIGDALQKICPSPAQLNEQEARQLIQEHADIVHRAFEGTTVAVAIINVDKHFMWAVGVGDSTVALSTTGEDGKRRAQRLCNAHTFKDPHEYFRATMTHKHQSEPIVSDDDPIGDFSLKLHASYLTHLFRYTPYGDRNPHIVEHAPKIITPPYLIAEPSVRFADLEPVWGPQTNILLFTDGVDDLVDGYRTFTPQQHRGANPLDVVSALLADEIDPWVEDVLGHKVEPRWSREINNRAVDVLGNLLGGTNVERLEKVTDQHVLRNPEGWPFYVDDTTVVVCRLTVNDV